MRDLTKSASRVFVTQDNGKHNIFPALKFGEVRVFTRKDLPVIGSDAFEWMFDLEYWLGDFDERTDYLLLLGDPVLIAATAAIMGYHLNGFNLLKWDRQSREYIPVRISLEKGDQAIQTDMAYRRE